MKRRKQIFAPFAEPFYEPEVQDVCRRLYGKIPAADIMVVVNCAAWMLIARQENEGLAWLKKRNVDPVGTYHDYPLLFAETLLAVERVAARWNSSDLSWKDLAILYSRMVSSEFHTKQRVPEGPLTHKEIAAAVSETIGKEVSEVRVRVALNRERSRRMRLFLQWNNQHRRDHGIPPITGRSPS